MPLYLLFSQHNKKNPKSLIFMWRNANKDSYDINHCTYHNIQTRETTSVPTLRWSMYCVLGAKLMIKQKMFLISILQKLNLKWIYLCWHTLMFGSIKLPKDRRNEILNAKGNTKQSERFRRRYEYVTIAVLYRTQRTTFNVSYVQ